MGSNMHIPLIPEQFDELADALGDTPDTVISVHLLRRRLCNVHLAGNPCSAIAGVIQAAFDLTEPMGFGSDPQAIWELLKTMAGWNCISVPSECAADLAKTISEQKHTGIRYVEDVYHTLTRPASVLRNDAVREFTLADLELLESAPPHLRKNCFENTRALLTEGSVAGAIMNGRVVALAFTSALTPLHADIGVNTLGEYRCRGFASAVASVVARAQQQAGRIPVWSTGDFNSASLRVAQKVGFLEVFRRTYVVLKL